MGQGYTLGCEKCNYTIDYYQGVGFLYPVECNDMLEAMLAGKFGKRFKEIATNAASPRVEFSREMYRCEKCGELRADFKIELYDGDKVVLEKRHMCGKCRNKMSLVKSTRGLKCPHCKTKLKITHMINWD